MWAVIEKRGRGPDFPLPWERLGGRGKRRGFKKKKGGKVWFVKVVFGSRLLKNEGRRPEEGHCAVNRPIQKSCERGGKKEEKKNPGKKRKRGLKSVPRGTKPNGKKGDAREYYFSHRDTKQEQKRKKGGEEREKTWGGRTRCGHLWLIGGREKKRGGEGNALGRGRKSHRGLAVRKKKQPTGTHRYPPINGERGKKKA